MISKLKRLVEKRSCDQRLKLPSIDLVHTNSDHKMADNPLAEAVQTFKALQQGTLKVRERQPRLAHECTYDGCL